MSDIYPGMKVPYVKHSDTSKKAAGSMANSTETLRAQVLEVIRKTPCTCDEIEELMDGRHQTISARVTELKRMGLIEDSGRRKKTRSGRSATIYRVVIKETLF